MTQNEKLQYDYECDDPRTWLDPEDIVTSDEYGTPVNGYGDYIW
ncbi:MAG: hypothetical protein RSE41_01155 [Clostridia bacterium]